MREVRAVAAEIGWIETSLPAVVARAIRTVEDLLSVGHAEGSEPICHQLRVFEAFEYGLLATWETPEELVCLCVSRTANRPSNPRRRLCVSAWTASGSRDAERFGSCLQ